MRKILLVAFLVVGPASAYAQRAKIDCGVKLVSFQRALHGVTQSEWTAKDAYNIAAVCVANH